MKRAELRTACRGLPIFPLRGVMLFPHTLLPLHVSEPRYVALVRDCVTHAPRPLAIVEIQEDADAAMVSAVAPSFHPYAGVGIVGSYQDLPSGHYNVLFRGLARVRVERELSPSPDRPYRMVEATLLDDVEVPEHVLALQGEHIRELFALLVGRLGTNGQPVARALAALPAARVPDAVTGVLLRGPAQQQAWLAEDDPHIRGSMIESAVLTLIAQASLSPHAEA